MSQIRVNDLLRFCRLMEKTFCMVLVMMGHKHKNHAYSLEWVKLKQSEPQKKQKQKETDQTYPVSMYNNFDVLC